MKKLALIGGSSTFYKFISLAFDGEIEKYESIDAAAFAALDTPYEAIVAIAEPGKLLPMPSLEALKALTQLWNKGQRVYAELCDVQDSHLASLFGARVYGAERALYNENFIFDNAILQAPTASFQPDFTQLSQRYGIFK